MFFINSSSKKQSQSYAGVDQKKKKKEPWYARILACNRFGLGMSMPVYQVNGVYYTEPSG